MSGRDLHRGQTPTGGASGCLDLQSWRRLAAARDASPADPPGWEEALRHLDGCPACRTAAVAADPLLAFRRLPPPALAADEAESMLLRVAALRGASRVGAAPASSGFASSWLASQLTSSRRLAAVLPLRQLAAAAVVAAALLAGGNAPQQAVPAPAPLTQASAPAIDAVLAAEPVLDELDRPFDHVVQWNGDDLSVVLVVDGRLGV
ncbi:MAG TPA: hypothetical protein VN923_11865 [Thermoanaerobaculia bacterium]|nr:hypothetical protein [Thermoanaerobaculia bacterium]